jgi:hypothetical protein
MARILCPAGLPAAPSGSLASLQKFARNFQDFSRKFTPSAKEVADLFVFSVY